MTSTTTSTVMPASVNTISVVAPTASTVVKAYIVWDDDQATQSMDNQADTEFAQRADTTAQIKLQLKFTQKN